MARDATARLYDVDAKSVIYKKPDKKGKYDRGTITFRAKKGKLINLDKLHESIWATRLSGGTRSSLVTLDVTVVGEVMTSDDKLVVQVAASDDFFVLGEFDGDASKLEKLRKAFGEGQTINSVTGRVEGWVGHWPQFLNKAPPLQPRLLVSQFELKK